MSKHKLARFAENATFENLFQHTEYDRVGKEFPLRGRWKEDYFHNDLPIVLELGCGKGEYTVAMAKRFPERNYIGIDRKGARLWRGCKDAIEQGLDNVAFLRITIDHIEHYFAPGEVGHLPGPADQEGTEAPGRPALRQRLLPQNLARKRRYFASKVRQRLPIRIPPRNGQ